MICGDFNIDLMKRSTYSERIIRIIESLGMKQLVMSPTRITKASRTLIDYVITNVDDLNVKVLLDEKISDHSTITFNLTSKTVKSGPREVTKICKYTRESFVSKLLEIDWSNVNEDDVHLNAKFLSDSLPKAMH